MPDDLEERAAAAVKRRAGMHARKDRPKQRRWTETAGSRAFVGCRMKDIAVRDSVTNPGALTFTGVASAYGRPYDMFDEFGAYTEVVAAGAGSKSLKKPGLDVPLVLQHDSLRRIARTTNGTLKLSETPDGLQVHAPQLDPADPDVAYIVPKLRSGLIDEMSFMFVITDGQWSEDFTEFRILSYDIDRGDVAIVGFGANPATSASVRAALPAAIRSLPPASTTRARPAALGQRTAAMSSTRLLLELEAAGL